MDIVLRYEGAVAHGFTTQLTVAATQIRGVENRASVGASTVQGSASDIRRMWHGRVGVPHHNRCSRECCASYSL